MSNKEDKMKIKRVKYGEKDTPEEDREYQIELNGPVGTIEEFKRLYPNEEFEIEDNISGDD